MCYTTAYKNHMDLIAFKNIYTEDEVFAFDNTNITPQEWRKLNNKMSKFKNKNNKSYARIIGCDMSEYETN